MRGIIRSLVIGGVAGVTIGGHAGKVAVGVALRALHRCMGPGQRKWRVVVIERRAGPRRSRVA